MDKIFKLEAKRELLTDEMNVIVDKGAEATSDDAARFEKLEADIEKIDGEISQVKQEAQAIEDRRLKLANLKAHTVTTSSVVEVEESPKAVLGNVVDRASLDPKGGFANIRGFFKAAYDAEVRGVVSENLKRFAALGSDEQTGISNPKGGYLIPTGFMNEVLSTDSPTNPFSAYTTSIPMETNSVEIPALVDKNHSTSVSGGLTVSWGGEAQETTASNLNVEKVKIETHYLRGLSYATEELLSRSPISISALLEAGFSKEIPSAIAKSILRGTGVGEYTGIIGCAAEVAIARAGANAIAYADVIGMYARAYNIDNCVWVANQGTLPQLMSMVDAGSNSIWINSARDKAPNTLLGLPIIYTEHASALGTKGDLMLINFSQYIEGVRQTGTMEESIHVRFSSFERAFRIWTERGGAPWWRSALTPVNGSTTLSPFVVLTDAA